MRENIIQVVQMRGGPIPKFTSFDLSTLNLPADLSIHPDAADYFRTCIPVAPEGPGVHELHPPERILEENSELFPCASLSPFGFIAFGSEGNGDAIALDLTTAEVFIFSHEIDYSEDTIASLGPDWQEVVVPKTRAAIIESAVERFSSLKAYYDDWKRQLTEIVNKDTHNA